MIEHQDGQVVGIEVWASATVRGDDFAGLRKLAEASGKRFVLGLVLYDHDTIVPVGRRMFAAPISMLWGNRERAAGSRESDAAEGASAGMTIVKRRPPARYSDSSETGSWDRSAP